MNKKFKTIIFVYLVLFCSLAMSPSAQFFHSPTLLDHLLQFVDNLVNTYLYIPFLCNTGYLIYLTYVLAFKD